MSRIKILPDILSNKIAAGEVVERPASVVKELVENALDAGSSKIIVEIENGGRKLIRVSDNGVGMDRDDALLAVERYATSKIFTDDDLFAIKTLGFRGEALPSIASVSRFTMETRDADSPAGTMIEIDGGKLKNVTEIGAPVGTQITVRQLFFNTPARRKFLKTVNTEMGHITDVFSAISMAWPSVQFRLLHNDKTVKNLNASANPADRVIDLIGGDLRKQLVKIDLQDDKTELDGWISTSRITRSTSRNIYIYVNGRYVRDRVIQHAIMEGYERRLMKGRFPAGVLFIKVPPDTVDVNVHPAKQEVRFVEHRRIHDAIKTTVAEALSRTENPDWRPPMENHLPEVSEAAIDFKPFRKKPEPPRISHPEKMNRSNDSPPEKKPEQRFSQSELWERNRFDDLKVVGQIHNTYIVCESDRGVVFIDQHAAHERILFETLKNRNADLPAAAQKLLIPETFDLTYKEADILKKLIPGFAEIGFEIEPFGGLTFVITAVPSLLAEKDIKPMIREVVEKIADMDIPENDLGRLLDESLVLMACHDAIRANQRLSDQQIAELLKRLKTCEDPSHCPHGRPTWIEWTTSVLEKSFRRIV